jgi:hypothetical protein
MSTPSLLKKAARLRCDEKNKKQIKTPALHYSPRYDASSRKNVTAISLFFRIRKCAKSFLNREREREREM